MLLYQGPNHNMEFLIHLQFSSRMDECKSLEQNLPNFFLFNLTHFNTIPIYFFKFQAVIDLRFMDESKNTSCLIITENCKKTEPISYDLIIKDPSLIAQAPSNHFLFYFGKVSLNHNDALNLGIEYIFGYQNAPQRQDLTKRN